MNPLPETPLEAAPVQSESDIDRRTQPDRRNVPTGPWQAFFPFGRRQKNRRADEHQRSYFVDRFSPTMFLLILLLVAASITDAVFTILLIGEGAKEINPLMDHFLGYGQQAFLSIKYLLTVCGLPLLLIFQNHRLFRSRLRVRHLIPLVVALYAVLLAYQIVLMRQ